MDLLSGRFVGVGVACRFLICSSPCLFMFMYVVCCCVVLGECFTYTCAFAFFPCIAMWIFKAAVEQSVFLEPSRTEILLLLYESRVRGDGGRAMLQNWLWGSFWPRVHTWN